MINHLIKIALWCLCIFSVSAHSQDEKVENKPRFDPFKKPDQLVKTSTRSQKSENLFQTKLQLFATLRAGKNSMVNIQGKIVQLGEEIEGYKLVEVNDDSAVFANSEQRVFLSLDTK
jgi:hypothetical protein